MVVWTLSGRPGLRASSRPAPPFIAVPARAGGGAGSHPRVIVDPVVDPYEPWAHLRVAGRGLSGLGALGCDIARDDRKSTRLIHMSRGAVDSSTVLTRSGRG